MTNATSSPDRKNTFWNTFLRAVEPEPVQIRSLRGSSGLSHSVVAAGADRVRKRLVVISGDPDGPRRYLAIRSDQDAVHLFPTQHGVMTRRNLQRRLVHYDGRQCNIPVTTHRLRHTFASQMLAAGMPVTSLQRYLGHEQLDITMLYAEVSDPLLRQDYYQGIAALDPTSENSPTHDVKLSLQDMLLQLVKELKTPGLEPTRHDDILEHMQRLLEV